MAEPYKRGYKPALLYPAKLCITLPNGKKTWLYCNEVWDVSAAVIWESCKAYLRGEIKASSAYQSKIAREKKVSLSKDIAELQSKCVDAPNADVFKELLTKKAEYDILVSNETAESLLKMRHNYYEFGDKQSELLAHQIRQSSSSREINQINTDIGTTINPQTINNQFRKFYGSLYSFESLNNETQFKRFFSSLDFPSITSEMASSLDAPFTINKLKCALKLMQNWKCPGPHGFPAEVEEASCSPSSLMSLLCLPLTTSPTAYSSSVVDFLVWKELGIVSVKQLYISSIFASFDQLTQVFNLKPTHFFRYLQ
ncbi:hypothetical protein FQN60_011512, partial [Etheostoma spectabile]